MSNRSWFYASNGQQQGPFPEAQFRDLIARGGITPETLVWSDGMTGWQKAGEVPGLFVGGGAPRAFPQDGRTGGAYGGVGLMSVDFGIWDFTWRSVLFFFGLIFIIPTPWVVCWYTNWLVSRVQVPGRPNLSFTGKPGTIALWYFGVIAVVIVCSVIARLADIEAIGHLGDIVAIVLNWLFLRYLIANIASNGQPLGLSFSGSIWAFLGWGILSALSILTIIGWAWVYTAQMRWICRNIQGTRRQVLFNGTGLEFLWRMIVTALASSVIIPIPWVYRWMMRWQLSRTALVARGVHAT